MKYALPLAVIMFSCQNNTVHPPVGGALSQKDLEVSRNRTKSLNTLEREQIAGWFKDKGQNFYSTGLNYWTDIPNLDERAPKGDGEMVSYEYEIYDFDEVKIYEKPVKKNFQQFGKFEELKAVEHALRYLNEGENATLLVPSSLAYGTYGDDDKIPNDMPLIIKLKLFKN